MTDLHALTQDELTLIAGIPYRVGVWVSQADNESGGQDDTREKKTIEKIIRTYSKRSFKHAFVRNVMRETLKTKYQWAKWDAQPGDVLGDCQKAVAVLKKKVSNPCLRNYKRLILKVAAETAGAYGEFGEFDDEKAGSFALRMFGGVKEKLKGAKRDSFMNISPTEDEALKELASALGISDKEEEKQ